jgi:hypothetical protein
MSIVLFANDATGQLAGPISNTATSVTLQTGQGALFPSPTAGQYFVCTFVDAATGLLDEIVWCTSRSSDTLTIARAQEGTTALAWNAGDYCSNQVTAGTLAQMLQQGQSPSSTVFYGAADTGTANAIVTTVTPALGSLADGQIFEIQPANTNTSGTVTLNISAQGNVNGFRSDGTALLPGDYVGGGRTLWAYKSTGPALYLLNPMTWVSQPSPTKISTNLTLYVSTTGSDSNNGLTSGTAFATLQHAWNVLSGNYNLNGYTGTIQLANGTYTAGLSASQMPVGVQGGQVSIVGNAGTPSSVIINVTGITSFVFIGAINIFLNGMTIEETTSGSGISATNGAYVSFENIVFGQAPSGSQLFASSGGSIVAVGPYTISGSAASHYSAVSSGSITAAVAITVTGTPAFTNFAAVSENANLTLYVGSTLVSFSGSATGSRYSVSGNGAIYSNGGSASLLPGSTGGSTGSGGQYY